MKKFNFKLENCHGIKKIEDSFNFTKNNINNSILIYAPNGTMKTSFTNTFRDMCNGIEPKNIVLNLPPKIDATIILDNDDEIKLEETEDFKEYFYVIPTFEENYDFNHAADLIVNEDYRKDYDEISAEINDKKSDFLNRLKKISKLKVKKGNTIEFTFEKEFQEVFETELNLLNILLELKDYNEEYVDLSDFSYELLFGDKAQKVLKDETVKEGMEEYVNLLDKLLDESPLYSKNKFDNNHLNALTKNIKKNNLFLANHTIKFKDIPSEITSFEELEELIEKENSRIFNDSQLKDKFENINNELNKTVATTSFKDFFANNQEFIKIFQENTTDSLKYDYWISLIKKEEELLNELYESYTEQKENLEKIRIQACNEATEWENVTNLFNKRFNIPFKLQLNNKEDVILNGNAPKLEFIDYEFGEENIISFDQLKKFYSEGQKRAIYLLNILYELEKRKKEDKESIVIVDDIADSFDYNNKYAIIEYLNDLCTYPNFNLIILTHNFDFYRTVKARLTVNNKNTYYALKNEGNITLKNFNIEKNTSNIFKVLQDKVEKNDLDAVIAVLPFIRNLTELYQRNKRDGNIYRKLTNILHYKTEGKKYKWSDVRDIYERYAMTLSPFKGTLYDLIFERANAISDNPTGDFGIERKIVLSIAIRLKAEEYVLQLLDIKPETIKKNQTKELFKRYKQEKGDEGIVFELLDKVNIMTPENIHINSFMYEPLIDMSEDHLIKLYKDIKENLIIK